MQGCVLLKYCSGQDSPRCNEGGNDKDSLERTLEILSGSSNNRMLKEEGQSGFDTL